MIALKATSKNTIMKEKMNRYHGHRFTFPTDFYVFLEATISEMQISCLFQLCNTTINRRFCIYYNTKNQAAQQDNFLFLSEFVTHKRIVKNRF